LLFYKHLKNLDVPESEFLEEIKNTNNKVWFTAKNIGQYKLDFVKNKTDAGFFLARLKHFPKITEFITSDIPEVIIPNSYVTRCAPGYTMEKHIDAGRHTAIIIPLGSNKGLINFYIKDIKISTCNYKGPTLSRVDVIHSAVNCSLDYRYSITVEIPGTYFSNYFKYQ
jgi:hypothetical protein